MMRQTEKWFTDRFFDLFFPADGFGEYSCQLPEKLSLNNELTVVVCGAGAGVLESTIAKDLCQKASIINVAFIDISDEPLSMLHWILQHHSDSKEALKAVFDAGDYPRISLEELYHTDIGGCQINYAFFVEDLELNPNPQNLNFIENKISDKSIRGSFDDFLPHILDVVSGGRAEQKREIDVVIMSMVLQHLSYWRSLIAYFNRYLAAGGFFLVNEFGNDDYLLGFDVSNALLSVDTDKKFDNAEISKLQDCFRRLIDRQFSILSDNNEICATNIDICHHFFEYWGGGCDKTTEVHWESSVSGEFIKALFSMPMFSPFRRYNSLIGISEERLSQCISDTSEFEMHFSLHWYLFGKLKDPCIRHFDVIIQERMETADVCQKLRRYIAEVFEKLQANTTIFSLMRNESLTCKVIPELFDLIGRFCLFGIGKCSVDQLTLFINGYDTGYVFPFVNSALCGNVAVQIQLLNEIKQYNVSLTKSKIPSSNELFFNVYKDVFTGPFAVILNPRAKSNRFRDNEFHHGFHFVRLERSLGSESFSCKTVLNQNGLSADVFKLIDNQGKCIPDKRCALIPCFRENVGTGNAGVGREFTASLIVGYRNDGEVINIEEQLLPFYSWLMRSVIEFSGIGVAIDFVRYEHKVRVANTHSAIGSIMSRNGSHNIGSHVLAALSHNVGTMPDDQVLYQYIQHRMDYIATATTDRPTWTQPTMFVGDMVRRLLSQRHLLNYICRSEGLKAFEFQSDRARINDKGGRIRLHVRKVDAEIDNNGAYNFKGVKQDFIQYSRDKIDNKIDLKEDVSLAIPGGVVGQHAFFTIIENIIRNAAKHDWSTPPQATAVLKETLIGSDHDGMRTGDLDVYIDYIDKPENENVKFVVWARLSDVEDEMGSRNNKTLDAVQREKLQEPFVNEGGALRRENWGLAEMKISAGYLRKAKIEDIGGISENKGAEIITPCKIDDKWSGDKELLKKAGDKNVQHLGYTFDVPKAKVMLFVVDGEMPDGWNDKIAKNLLKRGIYVKTYDEIKTDQEGSDDTRKPLDYQYVVLDGFGEDQKKWMLPFRVLAAKSNSGFEDHIPLLEKIEEDVPVRVETVFQYLSSVIDKCKQKKDESSDAQENKLYEVIVRDICSCWVRHLITKKRVGECGLKDKRVSLIVSATGNDKKAGQSLATIEDVVEFAFNEGLDKALETYKNSICDSLSSIESDKDVAWGINLNKKICDALISLKNSGGLVYKRTDATFKDYKPFIKRQLGVWLKKNDDSEVISASKFLLGEAAGDVKKLQDQLAVLDKEYKSLPEGEKKDKVGDEYSRLNEKLRQIEEADNFKRPMEHMVDYIAYYCGQIKNLLSKYSENIATLPKGFSVNGENGEFSKGWKSVQIDQFREDMLEQEDNPEKKKEIETFVLRYWRHETPKKPADYYLEPLSGTQTYLNQLFSIGETQFDLLARLVENALFSILIVDERTREFLENHPTKKTTFSNIGIFVANDKKVADELEILNSGGHIEECNDSISDGFVTLSTKTVYDVGCLYKNENKSENKDEIRESIINRVKERFNNKYDAIIIHQGIIDKWIPGASHSEKKVKKFIDGLKRAFKYVVITTGRGTPANIPDSGRVLPFSTIQTTLFKQYPEKLILTDAIMNILPVRCERGGSKHGEQ